MLSGEDLKAIRGKPEVLIDKLGDKIANPMIVRECLNLMNDPTASADSLTSILEGDPGLSARVLKLANSPIYSSGQGIVSIRAALVRLGNKNVSRLLLAMSLTSKSDKEQSDFLKKIWLHSMAVGSFTKDLAELKGMNSKEGKDLWFSLGLLHNLGMVLLASGGLAVPLAKMAQKERLSLLQVEKKALGFDHADVGAELAKRWNFPPLLREVMGLHHQPNQAKTHRDEVGLIGLADTLAEKLGYGLSPAPENSDGEDWGKSYGLSDIEQAELLEWAGSQASALEALAAPLAG